MSPAPVRSPRMSAAPSTRPAEFRYGIVLALTLATVVWQIVSPGGSWSAALALALQVGALVVIVGTSRARAEVRRARALVGAGLGLLVIGAVAVGLVPEWVELVGAALLTLAIPLALVGG